MEILRTLPMWGCNIIWGKMTLPRDFQYAEASGGAANIVAEAPQADPGGFCRGQRFYLQVLSGDRESKAGSEVVNGGAPGQGLRD